MPFRLIRSWGSPNPCMVMNPIQPRTRWILLTLWLVVFSSSSQVMIMAPILPRIANELGLPLSQLGSLITAYAASVGLFALLTGPISARIGRRRILVVGSLLMTGALSLHLMADGFFSLLALRALAGMAGGILSGASVAFVGDYFPSGQRGWANAWIMSGMAGGQMAGIPLGTILSEQLGFKAPFLAFAVTMAVATLMSWWLIPELKSSLQSTGFTLPGMLGGYMQLLTKPGVAAATLAYFLMFLGISLYVIYLPAWLASSMGFEAASIAGLFLVGGIANILAGPRAGKLSDARGRKPVILAASVGITLLLAGAPLVTTGYWLIFPLFFGLMGLFASRASSFQSLLTELVSEGQRGSLLGLTMALGQVGFGLGGSLAGILYTRLGFVSNALFAAMAALLAAGLVWRHLPETLGWGGETEPDPCAAIRGQDALCGPCPEAGHMARSLQDACAQKAPTAHPSPSSTAG